MSQVWSTRAAALIAALLLAGPGTSGGSARPAVPADPAREPLPAVGTIAVAVSPVLVPPAAPVDVSVRSSVFAGRRVDVQVMAGGEWVTVARPTLDADGRAALRLTRSAVGRYDVRAVADATADASVRSDVWAFTVTATGLGDPRSYRYLYVRGGAPARWNPCGVVSYRVNGADPESLADLREALRRVSYETGLRFREHGTTAHVPGARGFRYDADLVVAWVRASQSSLLGGNRVAAGGFESPVAGRGGRPRIRNGFVALDVEKTRDLPNGFGTGETEGQVLLHELGHVVGLDHVDADEQMMRPSLHEVRAALYGAGDLAGLRRIGRAAGCL